MESPADVLFCRCAYAGLTDPAECERLLAGLRAAGLSCSPIPDLCSLVERRDPILSETAGRRRPVIVACRPRAVRALFAYAGAELPEDAAVTDLRNTPVEEALAEIVPPETLPAARAAAEAAGVAEPRQDPEDGWLPWFPVIDYTRCTHCGKCRNFCLFDVYTTTDDGRVAVSAPRNCKTFCPACARTCPAGAIIFPKHPDPPIDGGEPDKPSKAEDAPTLVQQDVFEALKARNRRRQDPCECDCEKGAADPSEQLKQAGLSPDKIAEISRRIHEHARDNETPDK